MKKTKTIKTPKSQKQAIEIIIQLSEQFKMESLILSKSDFSDKMGTEDWVKTDYDNAMQILTDEVCRDIEFGIDSVIERVNKRKQYLKTHQIKNVHKTN
ncbi:MAG: hypothetical protein EBS09_11520 [Flavobacteriia bacterium]|nr:hypothetical protein [Flavobacteriia bacterium]